MIAAFLFLVSFPGTVYGVDIIQGDQFELNLPSKKGMQGDYILTEEGVTGKHLLLNLYLDILGSPVETEISQEVNGHDYYFNPVVVSAFQYRLWQAHEKGVDVTLVLLMRGDDYCASLGMMAVGEKATDPRKLYALNPDSEAVEAYFRMISRRFCTGVCYAKNIILGNEVNMPNEWNYTGTLDPRENARLYAETFYKLRHAMVYDGNMFARCYVSLDHSWMDDDDGQGIPGKVFLDLFREELHKISNNTTWHLAYHLYAPNLKKTSSIWRNPGLCENKPDALFVSPSNLEVICDYMRNEVSPTCKILLSEQGFDISEGEQIQAAGVAYCYYAALQQDNVEGVIFRSYKDEGTDGGLDLGFIDREGKEREAYRIVYQLMDGPKGLYVLAFYMTLIQNNII